MTPKTLIITGYGINSDNELKESFVRAGSKATQIHINDLISGKNSLFDFDILAFPGGFSFGDHIGSGKVFANKFRFKLRDQLIDFVNLERPVIGICNGFQVLVKMGFLPCRDFHQRVTLSENSSGIFEDRWVSLSVNKKNKSPWLRGITKMDMPVRHGEGRFIGDEKTLDDMESNGWDALFYTDSNGKKTNQYPNNPNNSFRSIAGITDDSGLVLGLMPHPEAYIFEENHPQFKRGCQGMEGDAKNLLKKGDGAGMALFYNIVEYSKSK